MIRKSVHYSPELCAIKQKSQSDSGLYRRVHILSIKWFTVQKSLNQMRYHYI